MSQNNFDDFYHWLTLSGLEYFDKFYSVYEAKVTSVSDPLKLGRVQVLCEKVGNQQAPDIWAYPAFSGAGANRGWFWPPEVGDFVWVAYPLGRLNANPLYFVGWFANGELPSELGYPEGDDTVPTRRGFTTRMGHTFVLNDEAGKEEIDLIWHKPDSAPEEGASADRTAGKSAFLKFKPDGSVHIQAANESSVIINTTDKKIVIEDKDNSNVITIDADGIKIQTSAKVIIDGASEFSAKAGAVNLGDGASKKAVLGDDLLDWLNQHTHPTGVGPSGPPAAPATPALLSTVVKVK